MDRSQEDYIHYRIDKADEILEDAELLAENERWNSCVNRLYYSSFYLVTALLYKNQIRTQTHNGVKTQFFLHFVKKGKVSQDDGKLFSHLFDWRQESDYSDFIEFDKETVIPLLERVRAFNDAIKGLIRGIKGHVCASTLHSHTLSEFWHSPIL